MANGAIPKVIHLAPGSLATHPYTLQLGESLRSLGVCPKVVQVTTFLKEALEFHPDIVHVGWLHPFVRTGLNRPNSLACLARLLWFTGQLAIISASGIKIVWTVHELEIPETHYPALDRFCMRLVTSLCTSIITHCENARTLVASTYCGASAGKVKTVPHGSFMDVAENTISRSDARAQLNIPESAFVILFFGLIRPYKGVAELVEAHRRLNRADVLLLIVGSSIANLEASSSYMAGVESSVKASANVKLIAEFIADEQIQMYMNASDVVAFPYKSVMTSGALIMAMGFGKPCIVPRLGCMGETVDDQGAFQYDPNEPSGLLGALTESLDNQPRLKAMGEHNRRLAQELSWQKVGILTLGIYQDCVSPKKDPR